MVANMPARCGDRVRRNVLPPRRVRAISIDVPDAVGPGERGTAKQIRRMNLSKFAECHLPCNFGSHPFRSLLQVYWPDRITPLNPLLASRFPSGGFPHA